MSDNKEEDAMLEKKMPAWQEKNESSRGKGSSRTNNLQIPATRAKMRKAEGRRNKRRRNSCEKSNGSKKTKRGKIRKKKRGKSRKRKSRTNGKKKPRREGKKKTGGWNKS